MKKKITNPSPPSLLTLPEEIIVNCLARISKSYYPELSLVCKTFCSLLLSMELYVARLELGTHENVLHVCLQSPDKTRPSWFSLWLKPDQTLTNNIGKKKTQNSCRDTLLVPLPSSYSPRVPMFTCAVGSELYAISKYNIAPSSVMWVRNTRAYSWRQAPSMTVARTNAVACVFGDKIYVMGGCVADESTCWAEVFDPKTQTWEPLPDPGAALRESLIKKVEVKLGKTYVKSIEEMDYVYDPKEGKWDIDNVRYQCGRQSCLWYDIKHDEWKAVKGLATLNGNRRCYFVEIANYGGKLLILWGKFAPPRRPNKNIWCAVIALERRNNDDEVWGKVEWASVVLTVPQSYVFLRCEVKPV
ncbi:hypothetical protein Bca4012_054672 [Brassica carinata]|uniref:F-box domain-containing protein n=1 Tax=Brassica carinata TaxID=52824 RepID=A0A8X7VX39_BRACI|nr:hypothetical protein Bca52824_012259 [Brassica carinata]